jgi:hypothetical protein
VATGEERLRRVGHNEALYRQMNETLEALNEAFSRYDDTFSVVCECGMLECAEQLDVPRAVYEQTRADSTHFIVKRGHQIDDVEQVVANHGTFAIVEKTPEEAQVLAEETDPRLA